MAHTDSKLRDQWFAGDRLQYLTKSASRFRHKLRSEDIGLVVRVQIFGWLDKLGGGDLVGAVEVRKADDPRPSGGTLLLVLVA